jgi:hypothetical protein
MPMEWDPLMNFDWPKASNQDDPHPTFASSPPALQNTSSWAEFRWQDSSGSTQPDPCLPPMSFQQINSNSQTGISPPSLGQSSTTSSRNLFPDAESYDHDSDDGEEVSDPGDSQSPQSPKEKRKLTRGSRSVVEVPDHMNTDDRPLGHVLCVAG